MLRPALLAVILAAGALGGCIQLQIGAPAAPAAQDRLDVTIVAPGEVTVLGDVAFAAKVQSAVAGDRVIGHVWSFGDGQSSPDAAPHHAFFAAGTYNVTLRIRTTLAGNATAHHVVRVRSSAGAPVHQAPPSPGGYPDAMANLAAPRIDAVQLDNNTFAFTFAAAYHPDLVHWDFGDGTGSPDAQATHAYLDRGQFTVRLDVAAGDGVGRNSTTVDVLSIPFVPHVLVGIGDSGIDPYHRMFYRPQLTAHPCTYIRGYPCSAKALNLTVGDFDASFDDLVARDRALWDSVKVGELYWIPRTNIVAAKCVLPNAGDTGNGGAGALPVDTCILDDVATHGAETASAIVAENPDALLAVAKDVGRDADLAGLPIDLYSSSWTAPPGAGATPGVCVFDLYSGNDTVLYVQASGNTDGQTAPVTELDCYKADVHTIVVGGANARYRAQNSGATQSTDVVSYFVRDLIDGHSTNGTLFGAGTSFAGPTVAGALSKVILAVRRHSGYDGSNTPVCQGPPKIVVGSAVACPPIFVDPIAGLTISQLRWAMNITSSYAPVSEYPDAESAIGGVVGENDLSLLVPLSDQAPWTQWGWGFYDGTVADATIACLVDGACPTPDPTQVQFLEAVALAKKTLYPPA